MKGIHLSLKEKIFYPFGQIGISLLNQALVLGILFYYSPPKGEGTVFVPVALAGLAITIGRFLDAIIDPLIAYLSDKTQSRFGRRIPYIAIGAPLLVIVFFFLWLPPSKYFNVGHFTNFIYLAVFTTLFWILFSVFTIPYTSLLPEIATTTKERIDLSTFVAVAMVVGMFIGGLGYNFLVKKSFIVMAIVLGIIAFICFCPVVLTIRERVKVSSEYSQIKIIPALLTTLKNKPYLIYLYSRFSFEFGWNLLAAGMSFMVVVIMGMAKENAGIIIIIPMVSALLSFPVINIISKKFGKKAIFNLTMLSISILLSSIFFIGKIELPISLKFQAYILMILMGPPFAGFLVLPNAIIADIIDYDEKLTGLRREGVYYGVQAFVIKVGVSLATFVAGLIMGYFGKNVGHDLGIRLLGPTAAFFIFIALIVFQFYPLEEKRETTAEPR
ncbi:MAG: hypothetical protein COS84_11130 [Armatimonadetes bacterium CG07_land_8_20_14_0_80_40_9]|nr:MAG: hypothetical protein COS84_11130 [Armatimonadetes bacterium CG07_land_8_20_14_0_80_40_9]